MKKILILSAMLISSLQASAAFCFSRLAPGAAITTYAMHKYITPFVQKIPGHGYFLETKIPDDGNCGFNALNITRQQFVDAVIARFSKPDTLNDDETAWKIAAALEFTNDITPSNETFKAAVSRLLNNIDRSTWLPMGLMDHKLAAAMGASAIIWHHDSQNKLIPLQSFVSNDQQNVSHTLYLSGKDGAGKAWGHYNQLVHIPLFYSFPQKKRNFWSSVFY
jgi:hypothetical protein